MAVRIWVGLLLAAAFMLVACGDSDDAAQQTAAEQEPQTAAEQQQGQAQPEAQAQGQAAAQAQGQSEAQAEAQAEVGEQGPLRIGLLLDFSGGLAEFCAEMRLGVELAIKHLNEGGGVFGQPVELLVADTKLEPLLGVEEARRLVEVEQVHAIVGALSSAVTLPVAESVSGPSGIPQIAMGTSPQLSIADDNDFLFRTTLSDVTQAPVLAQLIRDRGFDNIGVIYRDDPWGQGFADALAASWDGAAELVAIDPTAFSFLSELQHSARNGAQALVLLAFTVESEIILREAIEHGVYEQFVFGPVGRSLSLLNAVGVEYLADMYGTGPIPSPPTDSSEAWAADFEAEYGRPVGEPYVKEAYDAVISLGLAAQRAGSAEGAAIRDQMRDVGAAPGTVVMAGSAGVAEGLRIAAAGGELDYQGAAVTLDWDQNGDLSRGYVGVWRFTPEAQIELVEAVPFGD